MEKKIWWGKLLIGHFCCTGGEMRTMWGSFLPSEGFNVLLRPLLVDLVGLEEEVENLFDTEDEGSVREHELLKNIRIIQEKVGENRFWSGENPRIEIFDFAWELDDLVSYKIGI